MLLGKLVVTCIFPELKFERFCVTVMLGVPNGSSLYGEINQMNTYKKSTPSNHEYMEEYFHST